MHDSPVVTSAKSFGLASTAFLIVTFLTGIAGTLQTPTLSIFLTNEVHTRPMMMGFFFTGSAVIRILVNQFLAGCSSRRGGREPLIAFYYLLGVLACTPFTWNHSYFILLFADIFLSSFGSAANPQIPALAHEYTDKTEHEAVMFSSFLRAQVSSAWVTGPSLAYILAVSFNFTMMYLSAAVTFITCGVTIRLFLPSMQKELPLTISTVKASRRNHRGTLLLFVICTLMQGSNSLYIINAPLFIINELYLPEEPAGVMMGTAAGLEVPTMLIAEYFAKRLGKRFLTHVVTVDGVYPYAGMLMAHSPVILLGLQLLNAIFIGTLDGIGTLYFRDLMSGQVDSATALYTSTSRMDWIIIGSVAGIVAEIQSYRAVFWFTMMIIIATLFCLLRIKDAQDTVSISRSISQVITC